MKRDMNLIRDLLLFYESDCSVPHPTADDETIGEHLILLIEAGLLSGTIDNSGHGRTAFSSDMRNISTDNGEFYRFPLTWKGHDFIAASRDNNRWNTAMKAVGSFTFEIIRDYLQFTIRQSIGLD